MSNTPIDTLLAEYEAEYCPHDDLERVSRAALRYVETMPDSQVRCLLYVLAKHVRAGLTDNDKVRGCAITKPNEENLTMQTTEPTKPAEAQSFLTDELAAMKRDAERYRYLRSGEIRQQSDGIHPADGSVWVVKYHHQRGSIPDLKSAGIGAELDAAIDAAMAANK